MKKVFYLFIAIIFLTSAQAQNVGVGTTSPGVKLTVAGGIASIPATATAATSVAIPSNTSVFYLTATAGVRTDALTMSSPTPGQFLTIYNLDANPATFAGYTITASTGVMTFQYINSSWQAVSDNSFIGGGNYIKNGSGQQGSSSFNISGNGVIGGTATVAGNDTVSGGTLSMNNGTSNMIKYTIAGSAAPAFTTSSAGTRLLLYPSESASAVDYAVGIANSTLWYSVPQANNSYWHSFYGGTTELMRIQGDGKVGIGTASPAGPLHIANADYTTGGLILDDPSTTNTGPALQFKNSSAGSHTFYLLGSTGSTAGVGLGGFGVYDATSAVYRMAITSGGKVGIGTATPAAALDVSGAIRASGNQTTHSQGVSIEWNKDGSSGYTSILNQRGAGYGGMMFGEVDAANNVTPRMYIQGYGGTAGFVGINNTSPGCQLDVSGVINASSGFAVAGALAATNSYLKGNGTDFVAGSIAAGDLPSLSGTYVDLSSAQAAAGVKTWSSNAIFNGNVGIGTSSPNATLAVVGKGIFGDNSLTNNDANDNLYLEKVGSYTQMHLYNNDGSNPDINAYLSENTTGTGSGFGNTNPGLNLWTASAHPIRFATNATERMTILSGGNVGIGNAAPAYLLDVNGVINAATGFKVAGGTPATNTYLKGNGTNFAAGTIASGDLPATIAANTTGTAATVTTNANLTGPITSVGNATSVASQTGTGSTFAMSVSPVFTGTPTLPTGTIGVTQTAGTSNTTIATTAFVAAANGTNANLTGPITSVGNATSVAAQTGTGSTFVMNTSPTLVTPVIGVATGTSLGLSGNETVGGTLGVTGNATFASGTTALTNGTSNMITYTTAGGALPTFSTSSAGTKLLLYPQETSTSTDYAIGINSQNLWHSVPQATSSYYHTFYGGTTELMRIQGDGKVGIGNALPAAALDVNGAVRVESSQATHSQGVSIEWNKDGSTGYSSILNQRGIGYGGIMFGEVDAANTVTARMFISGYTGGTAGFVGINNLSPGAQLDVTGTVNVSGVLSLGSTVSSPKFRATEVWSQTSGLPGASSFTSGGGTILVNASGSGYSSTGSAFVGMNILIDGVNKGTCKVYTNESGSHKSFASSFLVISGLSAASHTIQLTLITGTTTDTNDPFNLSVLELPF